MKLNECIAYHMKLVVFHCAHLRTFGEAGCKTLHFLKSTCYTLDQCHLCERGNHVPYFLKRFRDSCVNGQKGLCLLLSLTRKEHISTPFFLCDGCILVVCLLLYIKKKFLLTKLLVFFTLEKIEPRQFEQNVCSAVGLAVIFF